MLYKEFEKNREDILENEFCMQSNASTLPITDCPSYTHICTIGICIQGNAKIRMDSQEYTIPVSYTHLDVYKRQVAQLSAPGIRHQPQSGIQPLRDK